MLLCFLNTWMGGDQASESHPQSERAAVKLDEVVRHLTRRSSALHKETRRENGASPEFDPAHEMLLPWPRH